MENNNYHRIGNAYLQYQRTVGKDSADPVDCILIDDDAIRLVNNAFAFCFKDVKLATTGGCDIEQKKYVGQVSTIIRILTSKDGGLISHSDIIDESEAQISNTTLKHLLISNHNIAGDKEK